MIDWNQLLAAHPDIAKYLLVLFVVSEGLSLLPNTITEASSVLTLLYQLVKRIQSKLKKDSNGTGSIK